MKEKFLTCSCSTCALQIQKDGGEFYVSIWHLGHEFRPLSWRQRFRWIWRILKTGNPWADSIVLSLTKAQELAKFIRENEQAH